MRSILTAIALMVLGSDTSAAFGRVDFAERLARGCLVKTLDAPNGPQLMEQFGITAREFCECMGEHTAASLTTDELRYLSDHNGEIPASVRDRPSAPMIEACSSLHDH